MERVFSTTLAWILDIARISIRMNIAVPETAHGLDDLNGMKQYMWRIKPVEKI